MSGGDSKKKPTPAKKDEPAIPGTSPMMTQPAFMPGNDSLLAQQLSAGGYGSMPDIMQMLTQTFTPMQVLNTQPGATPVPATTTTPTPATSTSPVDRFRELMAGLQPQSGQRSQPNGTSATYAVPSTRYGANRR